VADQVERSAHELGSSPALDVTLGLPPAELDPVLLRRVVDNLLVNAAKYAPGPVEVSIGRGPGGLLLQVDDHGPGVPPALRRRIFEPFERGASVDPATPGVGIGLALVLGFARSCGGSAWVADRDDGLPGASFRVALPVVEPATDTEVSGGR
jgi:signal transduction histidine kinase